MYNQNYNKSYPITKRTNNQNGYYDERGFWIPFAIGGLAGTALGYGISNNNYNNNPYPIYGPRPIPMPYYGPYYLY